MFTTPFIFLTLCASALATVYTTKPVASTVYTGGVQAVVSWIDDGTPPTLAQFGNATISVYVGNAQQQTSLQTIVLSLDVSAIQTISFVPNPAMGPNSNEYFIRFQSLNAMDPADPQYPALAFSSKFTLDGMTGTFSAAIQDEIDGQSTAPLFGATASANSTGGASTGAPVSATTSAPSTATHGSSSIPTPLAPTGSSSANAAVIVKAGWLGALLSAVVGASIL